MIAKHPKTGKDVRLLKAEGSIWKNSKTLVWVDANTPIGPQWDRWDIGAAGCKAWNECTLRGMEVSVMVLTEAMWEAIAWLESGAWKLCKMVAVSSALLDLISVERLADLGITNLICLDEMANIYPYLTTPWDGTEADARTLVAIVLHYTSTLPVQSTRDTAPFGLVAKATLTEPPKCVLITQYYKSPVPKRAKEIDRCLQKNVANKYIDQIILLTERTQEVPISNKVKQHVIGQRLRFNIAVKWIYDHVDPDTHVIIANSDIYMDDSTRVLWSINMSNVFFSLLRWDDGEDDASPPKMFGPRSDSQDTWIVSAKSVKERVWDWSTLDFPFGQGGCDNAFTIEMFRQKFLVVNPSMNLITHHVHNSGVRNYDPKDIVEKPVLMYVHPSGVHDLRPILSIDEKPVKTFEIEAIPMNLCGSYTDTQYATFQKMLSKKGGPVASVPAYKVPIYEFSNVLQTAQGLLHTHSSIIIGKTSKSHELWSAAELSVTAPCIATELALVAHLSDENAKNPVKYLYHYLGKILAMRQITGGSGEWLASNSEGIVEALQMFSWGKEEMPLISRNTHHETWCKKAYTWLPQDSDKITKPEVAALRSMLKDGWSSSTGAKRLVCMIDASWVTEDFADMIEKAMAVSYIYPSTSISAAVAILQGASDVVVVGKGGVAAWGLMWALPLGANVHEIQSEMEPSLDLYSFCMAADLKHLLHIVPRSQPNKADMTACITKICLPRIRVPSKDTRGFFAHSGDSFREMVEIWASRGYVLRQECRDLCNIWLDNVLLYDRPTFEWLNASPPEEQKYDRILLGNPFDRRAGAVAWSFWPRRPRFVEELVAKGAHKSTYDERPKGIVFYGRSENNVQLRRRTAQDWSEMCSGPSDEYVHIEGLKPYPFDQMGYLQRLALAKWGLCLPGYGNKCHREIECMAMGCVPIVTPGVDVENYAEPLKEGVHFIRVEGPQDVKKVATISKEVWAKMSQECHAWWERNASAEGMWALTKRLAIGITDIKLN